MRLLGLFAASVLVLAGCKEAPAPASKPEAAQAATNDPLVVQVGPELLSKLVVGQPTSADIREMLRVPGRIEADENRMARVGSPVAGRIVDLDATVGQEVRRGQVLATINSTELSTGQLAFLKALAQKDLAARAAARAKQLFESDVIGAAELQRRQSEYTQAADEANASRDQLKVLGMADAAIDKLAETRTINSRAHIVASVSGTIIERKVTEGQVVQPADPAFLVADLSRVWVVADVPEQSAGSVRVGETVNVEVPALPQRVLTGTLSFVSPTVNPETRTVRARMDLDNLKREFKPAMLASVLIKGRPQTRQVVPAGAIVREENRDFVFVRTAQDTFRLKPVVFGAEQDGQRVVQSGLDASESIVIDGAFHLNNERNRRLQGGS